MRKGMMKPVTPLNPPLVLVIGDSKYSNQLQDVQNSIFCASKKIVNFGGLPENDENHEFYNHLYKVNLMGMLKCIILFVDEVIVVNINHEIGSMTQELINYANAQNKTVTYTWTKLPEEPQ